MKTSDKILSFTAIFISCLALTVSIVQTRILQKQSHASVWPRLSNSQGIGPEFYNFSITNDGVGPAIVKSVLYSYQDTTFSDINELVIYFGKLEYRELETDVKLNFSYSNVLTGSVLSSLEKVRLFSANDSISVKIGKKYLSEIDIIINYCSIYDICWSMRNDEVVGL